MHTDKFAAIAAEVRCWLDEAPQEERNAFLGTDKPDLIGYHMTLGRRIRNTFKLWDVEHEPEIIDGVDHSEQHPDNLSQSIIEAVWEQSTGGVRWQTTR